MRTRYLWFMTVSVIYVLLVFVLHRHLHHFNVPDITDDIDVEGRQWIIDDNASDVDKWRDLVFPVVRLCVGPSLTAPSGLVPLGPDWLYTAYFDDRLKLNAKSVVNEYRLTASASELAKPSRVLLQNCENSQQQ